MGMMNQRLRLADAQGNIVVDTESAQGSGRLVGTELEQAIPLQANGETVGFLYPEGGVDFGAGDQRLLLARLNRAALISALLAGGLALILALLLAYRLLRPVTALTQAAGELAAGDLSRRVPIQGGDELAHLGKAFNHMAASLQDAEESRRAMTADIAHELRTPLAVQRAHLEALQDGVYPLKTENLAPILDQNHLLTRLVEDLRTLALADAGQFRLEKMPTDLPALLSRVAGRFEPQAAASGVALDLRLEPPSQDAPNPLLDPARIEQLLGNLLANALRYTPEGGKIYLLLAYRPQGVEIIVRDTGPGIPTQALAHIFERFYRADRSRSRAEGGSGLGLAIARQIAQAHGGALSAANHPQGGAVFTLTLPYST